MEGDAPPDAPRPLLVDYGPVQLCVYGEAREAFGRRIMDNIDLISGKALAMMKDYLAERFQNADDFFLNGVEVYADRTEEGGDFLLHYTYEREPGEFGDTVFEVAFVNHEPHGDPFWPFRFTIRYR